MWGIFSEYFPHHCSQCSLSNRTLVRVGIIRYPRSIFSKEVFTFINTALLLTVQSAGTLQEEDYIAIKNYNFFIFISHIKQNF